MASNTTVKRRYNDQILRHIFPSWSAIIYGAACGFLIPWTILLSIILPPHYVSQHWSIAWVGFDSFECVLFASTAFLAIRHSAWTALTATMLGTTMLIDAWFDIMTSRNGRDIRSALIEAFLMEIPIAILSFILAHRIFRFIRMQSEN